MSVYADRAPKPKIDAAFYSLEPDEREFFQKLTGIQDEDILKEHILSVQAKAYDIYGYRCIRRFAFIKLKIARLPAYKHALELLHVRENPILLDIGCCFGNDARKAVTDGWPLENVVASDIQQGFWDYGHELFKSTPETFPAAFIQGDVFDPAMLSLADLEMSESDLPPLHTLTSLTPLRRRISAIHASSFFHLFPEDKQLALAHRLAALLLPQKGSIIFGQHVSRPVKGFRTETGPRRDGSFMFCHSPETWRRLWTEDVFGRDQPVQVSVNAQLVEVNRDPLNFLGHAPATEQDKYWVMNWSVQVL